MQGKRQQMVTELQILGRVQHVNIVPLLGWSEQGEAPCLVYALMEGSLEDRLACAGGEWPLTSRERITLLSDVARGLAYLHSEVKVIHRDVKSANVLLDRGCVGRIGDFGIAKCVGEGAGMTKTHVHTQHIMGTQGEGGVSPCCQIGKNWKAACGGLISVLAICSVHGARILARRAERQGRCLCLRACGP